MRTPGCYAKLQEEMDTKLPRNSLTISSERVSTSQSAARELPYLHACIQEGFRVHPPFGIGFERIVPPTGAVIAGKSVPGGTVVSCSTGVVQYDKSIFGDDVDVFRPERWLETPDNAEKIRNMERTMFHFGAGNHTCLGKNIALMEIYKLIPSLLRTFEVCDSTFSQPRLQARKGMDDMLIY